MPWGYANLLSFYSSWLTYSPHLLMTGHTSDSHSFPWKGPSVGHMNEKISL